MGTFNTLYFNTCRGADQSPFDPTNWTMENGWTIAVEGEQLVATYLYSDNYGGADYFTGLMQTNGSIDFTADQWISAKFASVGNSSENSGTEISFGCRNGYYFLYAYPYNDSGGWQFILANNGYTAAAWQQNVEVGDVFRLSTIGSTITVNYNGEDVAKVTDTGTDVDGFVNVVMYGVLPYSPVPSSTAGAISFINLEVGSYTSPAPPPDPPGPTSTFLGSVRVVTQVPSGQSPAKFLGTFTKVTQVPSGVPNPYLGQVIAGTPSSGDTNPALGQVVEVASAPAGVPDPFLGAVEGS